MCLKAPYFATITSRFVLLGPAHGERSTRDRRRVQSSRRDTGRSPCATWPSSEPE
ncbi:hypothetical protein [Dyella sp.]|uniref:hypothetical protein n=1 Tax=Dyella sp. TaxID=1869338 RepID=UPI002D790C35|nr:hypothetical protein [Dyella sp.]HET6430775.1 hypothetical protein [Dyella sp.]